MSITEIVSLVTVILTFISSLSAAISCILHYRFSKPKIQIRITKTIPQDCFYVFQTKPTGKAYRCAYLKVEITNISAVAGTLRSFEILYNKGKFPVETVDSNYDISWLKITFPAPLNQDANAFRLKLPLVIPPYSTKLGFFIFPDFPPVSENEIEVRAKYSYVNSRVKVIKTKPFKMYNCNSYAMGILHYVTDVQNYEIYGVYTKYRITDSQSVTYSYVQNRFDLPK